MKKVSEMDKEELQNEIDKMRRLGTLISIISGILIFLGTVLNVLWFLTLGFMAISAGVMAFISQVSMVIIKVIKYGGK